MADLQKYEDEKEEKTSVSQYLKEHTSLLIAIVSAIVAITTFCMNACIYYINVRKLQFWGFSKEQLQSVSANQIYILAAVVLFIFYNILVYKSLHKAFLVYFEKVHKIKDLRKALKIISSEKKKRKRINRKQRREIRRQSKKTDGKNVTKNIYVELPRIKEQTEALKKTYDDYKPSIRSLRFFSVIQLLPTIIIFLVLGVISFYILVFALDSNPTTRFPLLPYAIIFTFLIMTVQYLPERLGSISRNNKQAKKLAYDQEKLRELMQDVVSEFETPPEYPASKLFNASWMRLPTNREISSFAVKYSVVMLALSVILVAYSTLQSHSSFPIVDSPEGTFAVVYQNGKTYYMEEATISGNKIEINTNKQRIVEANDFSYEIIEFEETKIIRNGQASIP